MPKLEKVVVIGAGITGACVARVLSKFQNLEVHLVEKEVDVGWGSSKANTAIMHAGYDDDPEKYPIRAKMCARGNALWRERWTNELDIPANWPGNLVIATQESEIRTLKELQRRGVQNGVPSIRIVWDRRELEESEPNITPNAVAALCALSAGQVRHPAEAVIAAVENALDNGVRLHLATEVTDIKVRNSHVVAVETDERRIEADWVINASGLYSDMVSRMTGINHFRIRPRRGEYILYSKDAYPKTKKILFPTPSQWTKGVVVTTTVDGNLMLGPNAQDLPEKEKEATDTTPEGLDFVLKEAHRIVKALPSESKVIRTFAGLRAEPEPLGDFIIRAYDEAEGFINAAGMRSPGFTSSPAVAEAVVGILRDRGVELVERGDWRPHRTRVTSFGEATYQEGDRLIKENPLYGKMVCQCQMSTEAEIVEATRRGATTLDGVKFRTQAMMGECQGSFCEFKIAQILARELGIPVWKVTKNGPGSEIGIGDITVLVEEKEAKTQ